MIVFDLIIIGSGPAGLSAAITGARLGLSVLVLEKDIVGGGPAVLAHIESYPGVESIDGWSFTRTMEKQARSLEVTIQEDEEVLSLVSQTRGLNRVTCESGNIFESKTVIIATGGIPKKLNVQGEDRLARKGVHTCAQCAGPAYKDGKVIVCGNGAAALAAAEHLLCLPAKVTLLTIEKNLRGDAVRAESLLSSNQFQLLSETRIIRIMGDSEVTGVEVERLENGQREVLSVDGIFLYIGLDPCTSFCNADKSTSGSLRVDSHMQTSVPGVFAAGGAVRTAPQIVIAAGDGALAALSAASYIGDLECTNKKM